MASFQSLLARASCGLIGSPVVVRKARLVGLYFIVPSLYCFSLTIPDRDLVFRRRGEGARAKQEEGASEERGEEGAPLHPPAAAQELKKMQKR